MVERQNFRDPGRTCTNLADGPYTGRQEEWSQIIGKTEEEWNWANWVISGKESEAMGNGERKNNSGTLLSAIDVG